VPQLLSLAKRGCIVFGLVVNFLERRAMAYPAKGLLSYVSPLACALLGKRVGDTVPVGSGEAEIVAIDTVPDDAAERVSG